MAKYKIQARYPAEIKVGSAEVLGQALDGTPMLMIVIDGTPYVIPYKLALELAKTIRRIVKVKPDAET